MKITKNIGTIIKILIIILLLILIPILSLSYTVNNNSTYQDKLIKEVTNNYNISNVNYINYYNNYYILKNDKYIVVLNKEYQEIEKKDLTSISKNPNNYEIIYRTKKLMYENTIRKKNKVIYEYYDISTYKRISETTLEK